MSPISTYNHPLMLLVACVIAFDGIFALHIGAMATRLFLGSPES